MPDHYPQVPGYKATGTSSDAAASTVIVAPILRDCVLDAIRTHGPLTADECADLLGKTAFAIRPRLSELHKMGKLEDSAMRRDNTSGHRAVVWRLVVEAKQQELL